MLNLSYDKDELKKLINDYLGPPASSGNAPAQAERQGNADALSDDTVVLQKSDLAVIPPAIPIMADDISSINRIQSKVPAAIPTIADAITPLDGIQPYSNPVIIQESLAPIADRPKPANLRHPPVHAHQELQPVPEGKRSYDVSHDDKSINQPAVSQDEEPQLDIGSQGFKIKFDFDGEYQDVPEDKPIRRRRERRTGCIGGVLYTAAVISISLVLASLIWMATVDVLGFGAEDELVNITISADFTIDDIADMLYEAGLVRYRFLFMIYADFSNAEEKISPGSYVLNKNYDYRALVQGMTERAGLRVETTVTIPEGFTLAQTFNLLEDYGVCSASDLWEAARTHNFVFDFLQGVPRGDRLRLEGFLFPETYNFYLDSPPAQVLNRLLREFDRRFSEEMVERAQEMGYSVRDIIIIASMIEREAGSDEERPRISAVIHNRLDDWSNPLLEIDATIHYAIAGTDRQWSIELDSLYNTYTHAGLPPGPIANPGMTSIQAALYPLTTDEYFYALNRLGTHNFFRTYEQQRAFVNSSEYGG